MKSPPSYKDKSFKYVRSESTNIAATFARVRKQLKQEAEAAAAAPKVTNLPTKKGTTK